KYKPDSKCTVCYRLAIDPLPPDSQGELILYGRIYAAGGASSRFRRSQSACVERPRFGRPLLHLPELDMVVWVFPNDRKLTGLSLIADERRLKDELLGEVLGKALGREWQLVDMTHDIVHYVPEHTCTVRLQLQVQQVPIGDRRSLTLYGKTYYDDEGAETYRIMRELWALESGSHTQSRMAQPVMYDSGHRLLWQAGLAGATLRDQDLSGSHFCTLMREAAVTVAWLHRSRVSCSRLFSFDDWLVKLEEMRPVLAQVRTQLVHCDVFAHRTCAPLGDEAEKRQVEYPGRPHRSCRAGRVWCHAAAQTTRGGGPGSPPGRLARFSATNREYLRSSLCAH